MSEHQPAPDGGAPTLDKSEPNDAPGDRAQSASAARYEPDGADDAGQAGRFWSVRRAPAALTAALLLGSAALLLYDVVSVRAERPAAAWRRTLADELATRDFGDAWVVLGASAVTLAGLWLLVLAATPGMRGLLPMRQDSERMRAGIARSAAAAVLGDRAMGVAGVRSVRVTVGRHRVRARAEAGFRELDEVRADLDSVLWKGIQELGLARRPALSVHVRRPPKP